MIPNGSGKPELTENDPEQLTQLLESELNQKRAEWKRAGGRYHAARAASFLFLFVVIFGALLAFFFLFTRVHEERPNRQNTPASDASRR
jgi:hypothetical protein